MILRGEGYPRGMTENPEDYQDQDAEPTMTAPGEGRPDGTVAPERDAADSGTDPDSDDPDGDEPDDGGRSAG